ncbi:hypothetical protein BP6252_07274 [Coleophoma cylindrospora]|uniref:FHA domain-containing protein n=1 Tax=Coleophoma cylindrospora TaxID=1849047 RepID=A0A3D8RH65_9HELO|nr:hypothetical protein BP6252_07274 [Coleophoma cylindrospora]
MWVLEHDGDALQGRRLWLRPGKRFLFGRTSAEGGNFAINDKTVSRKHMTLEIGSVNAADCMNFSKRSRVVLQDMGTKTGTIVNDEQIKDRSYELSQEINVFQLGRYKHLFRITWVSVAFSFSFTSKEIKADPYTKLVESLGPLDIKVLTDFERGKTSHVVANKRNTSKGLQALIDGKFIVNHGFVDTIIATATPQVPVTPEVEELAPLEEDFDAAFPNALDFLPARGQEPTQRPSEAYAPNASRQDMFDGYTYIFYDGQQFNNLLAPITEGRGKALLREVIPNETTVDEFVRYVKEAAGEKGLGEFEDGSEGKGVVVVRFSPAKGPLQPWYEAFCKEVALHLDHRPIEQSEFLDAILNNDASVLRRPLPFERPGTIAPPPSVAMTSQTLRSSPLPEPIPAETEPMPPPRKGRGRRGVVRKFKGFDSDDEQDAAVPSAHNSMVVSQQSVPEEPQSQGMFVSPEPEVQQRMEIDSEPEEAQPRRNLKRKTPPVKEPELDILEAMAPTAAARKRRREAEEAERREHGESVPSQDVVKKSVVSAAKTQKLKVKEELDVQQELIRRKEREREIAEEETQALQDQLHGMNIEQIRNLVVIEEMEVKRSDRPSRAHGENSERWNDKWNGRKNFKKFRPRGEGITRNLNRVIVPLEEVKKRDYGIGDDYWLETDTQKSKKKVKGRETQDGSQSQRGPSSRATQQTGDEPELQATAEAAMSSGAENTEEQPETAMSSRSQKSVENQSSSRSVPSQNKRPAATELAKPAPPKRLRQATIRKQDSDDSEDELKFRFRRKR